MIKFGTGGFRGIIADDFTKENVKTCAQAMSDIISARKNPKPVVIGYDYRFCSEKFAEWMAETFAANGIYVLLYGEAMPTPAVMRAVKDLGLDFGVMITASHNPYMYDGVKIFVKDGMDADVAFTGALEKAAESVDIVGTMDIDEARAERLVGDYSNMSEYVSGIEKFLDTGVDNKKRSRVKILYDNLHGVASKCLLPVLKDMGICRVDALDIDRDAYFGGALPNPTEETMRPLRHRVVAEGYSFAMGTDSDADRLGILDENGRFVESNEMLAAIYYYLVKYRGMSGDFVKNVATSTLLDMVAKNLGFACHEVDVGFKNISAGMRQHDALMGGESSGGMTVRGYIHGKDSVFAAALFAEMVTVMDKTVSMIIDEVKKFAGYSKFCGVDEIRFSDEKGVVEYIVRHIPEFNRRIDKIAHIDRNFKYWFDDGNWALLRLSGTEPVLRVYAEFDSEKESDEVIGVLRNFLRCVS